MNVTRSATLTRPKDWKAAPNPMGTYGKYVSDGKGPSGAPFRCVIGELPWRDDKPDISCVPGDRTVLMVWAQSEKHGWCYHMRRPDGSEMEDRSNVEQHAGNFCGDVERGLCTDVLGCQLPGHDVETFRAGSVHLSPMKPPVDQLGVTSSGTTLKALQDDMKDPATGVQAPYWLTISTAQE